nr:hypothetical protein [Chlamydia pecorum]
MSWFARIPVKNMFFSTTGVSKGFPKVLGCEIHPFSKTVGNCVKSRESPSKMERERGMKGKGHRDTPKTEAPENASSENTEGRSGVPSSKVANIEIPSHSLNACSRAISFLTFFSNCRF